MSWLVWMDGHWASLGLSVHPKHGDASFPNSVSSGWLAALGQRHYRICRVARYVGKLTWLEGSYNLSVLEALAWPLKGPITVDSIDAYGHAFLPVLTEPSGYKIETKLHIAHRLPSHSLSPFPFSLCFPPLSFKFLFFLPAWIMTLIQQWENNWSPTNASFSIHKALSGASVWNPFGKYHSYHTWNLDTPMGYIFSDSGLREPGEGAGLVSQGTNIICHVVPALPKAIDDYF